MDFKHCDILLIRRVKNDIFCNTGGCEYAGKDSRYCVQICIANSEYGVVISPLVKNEEHFLKWSDALPFYRNVKMEGVIVDEI